LGRKLVDKYFDAVGGNFLGASDIGHLLPLALTSLWCMVVAKLALGTGAPATPLPAAWAKFLWIR